MKRTLRLLCLEDDEEDFMIINFTLEKSGLLTQTKRVETKAGFITALNEFDPDVILSDHALPKFSSTEALQLCLAHARQIPFILVTGAVSDEFAANCMKLGADDYILKSNMNRLPSAIQNALKHKETEKARQEAMSSLATRNEELLKINSELDSFVYNVSHNLRAPLMSVLGLLNLAKQERDPEHLHKYHAHMEKSICKLDETLREILDYSRNARQVLKIETINFKRLISETLDNLRFMNGFDKLEVRVSIDDRSPFHSDYYRMSVILNNLVSNAIKYRDHTKDRSFFDIMITFDEKMGSLVFKDNGIGIDSKLTPRIFEMFFRANTTREGSGLGLYIVKEAIEKLNGTIELDSAIGVGTTFMLEIPNHAPAAIQETTLPAPPM